VWRRGGSVQRSVVAAGEGGANQVSTLSSQPRQTGGNKNASYSVYNMSDLVLPSVILNALTSWHNQADGVQTHRKEERRA